MIRIMSVFFITFFFLINAFATTQSHTIQRVIYITLDGVRWQDVFLTHDYFPKLWGKHINRGIIYGAPNSDSTMEVASIPISLPSYQSQLSGVVLPCDGNECGTIPVETFAEKIKYVLHLNKKEVATFSSWYRIQYAVEHNKGVTYSNTGNIPVSDPDTHIPDADMLYMNIQQAIDRPDLANRFDKYTFKQAMHYFDKYRPRFLWISFDDADEAAHSNNLDEYHHALLFYDNALDTLITTLENLNLYHETLVIVTTDHGRGDGIHWTDHGPDFPESKQTWAFVINGELKNFSQNNKIHHFSTLSIRPTIEEAFDIG